MSAKTGAVFDRTYKYRYLLWRRWNAERPIVCFVMLNPSTANAKTNDPTISRCISFAHHWGYGGLDVVNLFSYRSTDASKLARVRDPVGPKTDEFILASAQKSAKVVLAWGNHGLLYSRADAVLKLLGEDERLHHLGMTKSGQPRHPLYVPGESKLISICF